MKKFIFKTLLICSSIVTLAPIFTTTSCASQEDVVKKIIDIVENPQPESEIIKVSPAGCVSNSINKYVYDNYFFNDRSILKNEIIYDCFHLIKKNGLKLNNVNYTKEGESLIDLYKNNIVKLSASISSNNSIAVHSFPDLKKDSISASFQAALFIEYVKDYKINDSKTVTAGTIINCIPEFYEPEMAVCYKTTDDCPDGYYKSLEPYQTSEQIKYKWCPLYPSFNSNFGTTEKTFGVITILEQHISVLPITLDYMMEDTYTNYKFITALGLE